MIQIQVKVESKRVYQSIRRLVDDAIPGIVNDDIESAMLMAADEASGNYPSGSFDGYSVPFRPRQKYTRTGRYGRGFHIIKTGYKTKRAYSLINAVPYGPYVGGNAYGGGQAWMHRGRWPLIYLAVQRQAIMLTDQSSIKIKQAIRNEGLGT
jgi:hypothetical protein